MWKDCEVFELDVMIENKNYNIDNLKFYPYQNNELFAKSYR